MKEKLKESFKHVRESDRKYHRIRWTAKKVADEQIKAFLGKHYFTSEPCGLVF